MVEFSSLEHEMTFNLSGLYANTEYDIVLRQRPPLPTIGKTTPENGKGDGLWWSNDYGSTDAATTAHAHWSPAAVLSAAKTAASSECSELDEGSRETTVMRFPLPVYVYLGVLCIHLHLQNYNDGLSPSAILIFE